jgi:hypothetical protein
VRNIGRKLRDVAVARLQLVRHGVELVAKLANFAAASYGTRTPKSPRVMRRAARESCSNGREMVQDSASVTSAVNNSAAPNTPQQAGSHR